MPVSLLLRKDGHLELQQPKMTIRSALDHAEGRKQEKMKKKPGWSIMVQSLPPSRNASTTAALHWFVSPYIHKLRWQPGSDSFEVEMMSCLATFIPKTIKFADIRLPETNRPFVTFQGERKFLLC
ncbi:hypothetical protein OIU76_012480 [Salix suchowensis]|nr:hypothetical protein OIU76_012480 [Salix suchowensis]